MCICVLYTYKNVAEGPWRELVKQFYSNNCLISTVQLLYCKCFLKYSAYCINQISLYDSSSVLRTSELLT